VQSTRCGEVLILTWGKNGHPSSAKRGKFSRHFETARSKAEILYEGVHLGRFASGIFGITFPDDDVGICERV
jgi:hypothetical protein